METKQGWYKYLDQFSNPPLLRLVLHSADKLQCIRREKSWLKLFLILWDYAWCEIKYLEFRVSEAKAKCSLALLKYFLWWKYFLSKFPSSASAETSGALSRAAQTGD